MMDPKPATLHDRIIDDVKDNILGGVWMPGHRIPFETELAARYGCSRMTVNKALTELTKAGFLERRRRSGTVVRRPRTQSAVLEIADIEREITATGRAYAYALLFRGLRKATPDDRDRLELGEPAKVVGIRCMHFADGEPFCVEERLINLAVVPAAEHESFRDAAPGGWLLRQVPWSRAEHTISAVNADAELAGLLRLKPGAACLVVERRTRLAEASVTHARLCYPGTKHQLMAQFTPSGR